MNEKTNYESMTDTKMSLNSFSSEFFYCLDCLRKYHKITKGYTRYDSLVLCQEHNEQFKPIMHKIKSIFDNNHVVVIKDLGV